MEYTVNPELGNWIIHRWQNKTEYSLLGDRGPDVAVIWQVLS